MFIIKQKCTHFNYHVETNSNYFAVNGIINVFVTGTLVNDTGAGLMLQPLAIISPVCWRGIVTGPLAYCGSCATCHRTRVPGSPHRPPTVH